MNGTLVIVGASYAGAQLAASARELGFDGRIVLLGEEPELPYQRPPLSKAFLTGDYPEDRLPLRSAAFFQEARIDCMPSTRVAGIYRSERQVELDDGRRIHYDHLALTVGARVRKLNCAGADLEGVHYLRTLGDARQLRAAAATAQRAVVIGGGYIGLEAAASLRRLGLDVTVVETESRLLARVASPMMSEFIHGLHAENGVTCVLGSRVKALHGASGRVVRAELDDGRQLMCDLVLVGIGVIPNTELAAGCGLSVQGGILVDAHARTSDPAIFAAGDCAAFVSPWLPEGFPACRIESVQNANDMARAAASAIAGEARPYISLPWFWSDQHDVKLQMAGLNTGWTEHAVRGSVSARKFSFYYFREGRLIAVDSINRPQDHMLARKLLASGTQPSVQQVSDEGFDLARLIETRR